MRWKNFAVGAVLAMLGVAECTHVHAAGIFRCVGVQGELVFRDAPCSGVGLARADASRRSMFSPPQRTKGGPARCVFETKPLPLTDPIFEQTKLRLVIDIDGDGPYLNIVSAGQYSLDGIKLASATFDARVSSQGLQTSSGAFHQADWRMDEQTLGFGRSRMRQLLTTLSREEASLLVWFEGFELPVYSASIPAEDFRLAVDNVRRCWKSRAQGS